jgi:hypothetical protein
VPPPSGLPSKIDLRFTHGLSLLYDGQGHQFVITIGGHTYLYTLSRANGHIDVDDLYIHELQPQAGLPLKIPAGGG